MAFQTTATQLVVWRDALPRSYEPLLPLAPFGVRGPALSTFAADVSLTSGLEPPRAVVAVTLLAAGLVLLGLYALLGTWLSPGAAAMGSVVGLAAVRWPGFLAVWGGGGALLALALALPAAALMVGHTSRPAAAGAGFLWAAAALAHPWLTLAAAAVTAFAGPVVARRWMLAFAIAVVLAAPPLVRLTGVLSVQEALDSLGAVSLAEVLDFTLGLAIIVLSAKLAERLLGRRVRLPRRSLSEPESAPVSEPERAPTPPLPVDLTDTPGPGAAEPSGGTRAAAAGLAVFGAALLIVRIHAWFGAGQIPLSARVELAKLVRRSSPADVVCAPPGLVDWVPALATRAVGVRDGRGLSSRAGRPWVPPSLREESTAHPWPACTRNLDGSPIGPR